MPKKKTEEEVVETAEATETEAATEELRGCGRNEYGTDDDSLDVIVDTF